jgi:hypothetical protein
MKKRINRDVDMIDDAMGNHNQDDFEEFDDFTDQQKEFIQRVMDRKLGDQKEKLVGYFQNMQIEMIRQFQIQYLELSDWIDEAIQAKNRNKFINNLK